MLCRATSVMSDQGALWSDKVQTAIKNLFPSLPIILTIRNLGRHSGLGGHRGLTGWICMAKSNFYVKILKSVEAIAPLAPDSYAYAHNYSYVGIMGSGFEQLYTCMYNVNIRTVAISFTKNITVLDELMSQ